MTESFCTRKRNIPPASYTRAYRNNEISVFLGHGDGTYEPAIRLPTVADPEDLVTADLNNDGILDLVTANDNEDTVSILIGLGNGAFEHAKEYDNKKHGVPKRPETVVVGDFDANHLLDLAIVGELDQTLLVLLQQDDGTFAPEKTQYPNRYVDHGLVAGGREIDD